MNYAREERRRDLEIKERLMAIGQFAGKSLVERVVIEVPVDEAHPVGESLERLSVKIVNRTPDRFLRTLLHRFVVPVLISAHADDRTVKLASQLKPVEGPESHLFRKIPGDAENDQRVSVYPFGALVHGGERTRPAAGRA